MNCIICGRTTLKGAVIHEACKRVPIEIDDVEIDRRKRLVDIQRALCEEVTAELNARSALREIEKKISGKKK